MSVVMGINNADPWPDKTCRLDCPHSIVLYAAHTSPTTCHTTLTYVGRKFEVSVVMRSLFILA